jgi:hypothetical protein
MLVDSSSMRRVGRPFDPHAQIGSTPDFVHAWWRDNHVAHAI